MFQLIYCHLVECIWLMENFMHSSGAPQRSTLNKKYHRAQKPLKINPRLPKMEKWISSKNVNLIAKIRYKVNCSLKTK